MTTQIMKKYFLLLIFPLVLISCNGKSEIEKEIEKVEIGEVKIVRFDDVFYNSKPEDLPKLKEAYPYFFPQNFPDSVWVNNMNDPFMRQLKEETDKEFVKVNTLEGDLESAFKHMKYYFNDFSTPEVFTIISDNENQRAVYSPEVVAIPINLYLGKDNKLYDGLPSYQVQTFEPNQIVPDVVSSFATDYIAPPKNRTFLALIVYFGKELYMKDVIIPNATDAAKMGYTDEQELWAEENESEIWRYFIENKLLFDTDAKLAARFVNPAPFSKFYLELDNESPGRLGVWMGWQIVRAYMENNKDVTLQNLLNTDAKTIFDNSKYKPKK